MTELSRFWNSPPLGDSSESPYDAPTEFAQFVLSMLQQDRTTYLSGVMFGTLDEYEPTVTGGLVTVGTGVAFVYGGWHYNNAPVPIAIPTPTLATRRDRYVLRKDWDAQTIRITRLAGVEGGGLPPTVNTAGDKWDFPLFAISTSVLGTSTLETEEGRLWYPIPNFSSPEANVWRTAVQILPAGGAKISWDAGNNRMDIIWDVTAPTRFTVQRDGMYEVDVGLKFQHVDNTSIGMAFLVNGNAFSVSSDSRALNLITATAGSRYINIVTKMLLARGDYLEIYAYHSSLFDLDLEAIVDTHTPVPRCHVRFLRPIGGG